MQNTFRAKTVVELKAKVYKAHGWERQYGESMGARVAQNFDVEIDGKRGDFVARRRKAPRTNPQQGKE